MILSATFSRPAKNVSEIFGDEYIRIKIRLLASSLSLKKNENYFAEFYTKTQVFHKKMSENDVRNFIDLHAGSTFKNCVERTESEEITILVNKKGKKTVLTKKISRKSENLTEKSARTTENRKKNYLIPEGTGVPFLIYLGVMTSEGKVIKSKYDKFRQINRFLEMLDDILGDVLLLRSGEKNPVSESAPLKIVDFGSGKSYLTFAMQYFLSDVKKIPAEIFGLDLKKDVIEYCASLAQKLSLKNISFRSGDIASFGEKNSPDIIVTLHACDTATDYALEYAIRQKTKAILSVPCCQHEINSQLSSKSVQEDSSFEPLLKYGLIKERFSALATDAIRAEILEQNGYRVQILEFIEESATIKNLLIRAVYNPKKEVSSQKMPLIEELGVSQTLFRILSPERIRLEEEKGSNHF